MGGSKRAQGFSLVGGVFAWVQAGNDQRRAGVAGWLFGLCVDIVGEDGLHSIGDAVEGQVAGWDLVGLVGGKTQDHVMWEGEEEDS